MNTARLRVHASTVALLAAAFGAGCHNIDEAAQLQAESGTAELRSSEQTSLDSDVSSAGDVQLSVSWGPHGRAWDKKTNHRSGWRKHHHFCSDPEETEPPTECAWQAFNDGLSGGAVSDAAFIDANAAWAVSGKRVFATNDAGDTWSKLDDAPVGISRLVPLDSAPTVAAASGTGVWKYSPDEGWQRLALGGLSIDTLEVSAVDPRRWFASSWGVGILRSLDGGATWRGINQNLPFSRATDISTSPESVDQVVASMILLNEFGGSSTAGTILRSTDGGLHWASAYAGVNVYGLSRCKTDPSHLWAATHTGVLGSDDAGATWQARGTGLHYVTDVAISDDCSTLYASVATGSIHRSLDGGEHWNGPLNAGLPTPSRPVDLRLATQPGNADTLVVSGRPGLFLSNDAGGSFSTVEGVGTLTINDLVQSPTAPGTLWLGTFGSGLWTRELGTDWERVDAGALLEDFVFTLGPGPADPQQLLVGGWPSLWTRDESGTFQAGPQSNAFQIEYLSDDGMTVLAATQVDGVLLSQDGGATWSDSNAGLEPWVTGAGTFIDVRAAVFDADSGRTIIGTQFGGVYLRDSEIEPWQWIEDSGLDGMQIANLLSAGDDIYALAFDEGVARASQGELSWTFVNEGLPTLEVFDLAYDEVGSRLFVATKNGVFSRTGQTPWQPVETECLAGTAARRVAVIQEAGTRWLVAATGSGDGLFRLALD